MVFGNAKVYFEVVITKPGVVRLGLCQVRAALLIRRSTDRKSYSQVLDCPVRGSCACPGRSGVGVSTSLSHIRRGWGGRSGRAALSNHSGNSVR